PWRPTGAFPNGGPGFWPAAEIAGLPEAATVIITRIERGGVERVVRWRQRGAASRDREFVGAFLYGGGLAASALLGYAFNAAMGRRLSSEDFGTFAALLAGLLALSGPTTALFGGAAMAAAR